MIRFGEAADKNSDGWKMDPHRQIHVKNNLMDFSPIVEKAVLHLKDKVRVRAARFAKLP